jgi:hypothetical protein
MSKRGMIFAKFILSTGCFALNFLPMKRSVLLCLLLAPFFLFAQVPYNWSLDEVHPGLDIKLMPDDNFYTEGSRSCKMQLDSQFVPYLIADEFDVTPGVTYNFSIDVFDNDTLGQLKIYADFFDAQQNPVYDHDPAFSMDTSIWQTISWDGTVPSNAVKAYVMIKFYSSPDPSHFIDTAYAWVDDVIFNLQGGENLVANGGFENWTSGQNELMAITSVKVYPNPARDYIRVHAPRTVQSATIVDLMGKVAKELPNRESLDARIDVSGLKPGIYMMIFSNARGVVENKKLIKY